MSNYKPGTLDSQAVVSRWEKRKKQILKEASIPSGSQVFQTTEKVQDLDLGKFNDRLDRFDEQLEQTKDELDSLSHSVDVRFLNAEIDRSTMQDRILEISGRLSDLESEYASFKSSYNQDKTEINSSLSSFESRLNGISSDISSFNQKLADIEQSIEVFESSINEQIEGLIDGINEIIDEVVEQKVTDIVDEKIASLKPSNPVGSIIWLSEQVDPPSLGFDGTWEFMTSAYIPLTDDTKYYLYKRIEDDNANS